MMISTIIIFLLASGLVTTSAQNLQVFALPVGQGDCTIIQCPNGNIVVFDCGSSGGNRMTANEVAGWLGSDIDRVIAILVTHANRDHYNYLPDIQWNTANTRAVIIGGAIGSYPAGIRNWLNGWASLSKLFTVGTAQSSPSSCIGNCVVNTDTNFCSDQNIQFNILATNVGSTANQQSIVMKIVVGQWSMLLSGDMEGDASVEIANQLNGGLDLQSVVYKMSHHGASTSANMIDWLTPIAPQFAFASSGYNFGRCRHPRCETINRLLSLNTITMTTPHQFYCGNPGGNPSIDNTFQFNMLETSPNATHICLLTYVSSNIQPQSNCFLPTTQSQLTDDMDDMDVDDDDCDDFTADATGGAFCMAASSFVFTAAALLCAII